eukprot:2172594-Pyramimonas_sp.AAC.1
MGDAVVGDGVPPSEVRKGAVREFGSASAGFEFLRQVPRVAVVGQLSKGVGVCCGAAGLRVARPFCAEHLLHMLGS